MQAATAFGKRKLANAGPLAPAPPAASLPANEGEALHAPAVAVPRSNVPFVTFGLILVLVLIYWAEVNLGFAQAQGLTPTAGTLTAFGGLDGALVFGAGEWWRVFTAPLLHGSLTHLIGNAVALFFAGLILERLVGPSWFAALFVVAALGGAAGTLAVNPPNILSVGASGAIVGLLATAFVCSFLFEGVQLRRRMQKISLRFLVPSLVPALLPVSAASGTQIDYGAHIGGAIAGVAMGFLLSEMWPETSPRPPLRRLAAAIAIAGSLAAAAGFLLTAGHYADYASRSAILMPDSELPTNPEDGVARSADLVNRYPRDPRAHLFRATYFLQARDAADAERQLRLGLAEHEVLSDDLPPQVERSLQVVLAVVLLIEGRKAEAKTIAAPLCGPAFPSDLSKLRAILEKEGVCP